MNKAFSIGSMDKACEHAGKARTCTLALRIG